MILVPETEMKGVSRVGGIAAGGYIKREKHTQVTIPRRHEKHYYFNSAVQGTTLYWYDTMRVYFYFWMNVSYLVRYCSELYTYQACE